MEDDMNRIAPHVKKIKMSVKTGEGLKQFTEEILKYRN
jgi:Ni2+-binding GTPase involved in maturation of urease and hydrogenase